MPAPIPSERLVTAAFELRAQIAAMEGELAQVEGAIIALGKGKHTGIEDGHSVTVIEAIPAGVKLIPLAGDDLEKARAICGESFFDLFEKSVTYQPKSGFADRADTALMAQPRRDILALVQKPTPEKRASVRYAKAA